MDDFITWLIDELNAREWTNSDLARHAGISQSTVSLISSGQRNPGWDSCAGIARAFGLPPDVVFRKAGLLPSEPSAVIEEKEALAILRSLSPDTRATVMQMLRGLKSVQVQGRPALVMAGDPPPPAAKTMADEIAILVEAYPKLGPLFNEAQVELPEHAVRALITNVKVWIHEKNNREGFTDLHNELGRLLSAM